jgi:streptogramin lyase
MALLLATPAAAKPVYVADNAGKVEKVNPKTSTVSVVSTDPLLGSPGGITIARNGKLLVSDFNSTGNHGILRVDPTDGTAHTIASGSPFVNPFDLAQAKDGTIYTADEGAGPAGTGAILKINPSTGNVKPVAQGNPFQNPFGIALVGERKLYVADDAAVSSRGAILRVTIKTGAVKVIAHGSPFRGPTGLERGPDGKLYVADYNAGPGMSGAIFRVNPKSGSIHTVRQGPPLDEMYGIDFDANGRMWFPADPDTDGDYDVFRMKPTGAGLHGIVSTDFGDPYGVAAAP